MKAKHKEELVTLQNELKEVKGKLPEDFDPEVVVKYNELTGQYEQLQNEHKTIAEEFETLKTWRSKFDLENDPDFQAKYDPSPAIQTALTYAKALNISESEIHKLSTLSETQRDARLEALEEVARDNSTEAQPFSKRTFAKMENALMKAEEISTQRQSLLANAAETKKTFAAEMAKTRQQEQQQQSAQIAEKAILERQGQVTRMKMEYAALKDPKVGDPILQEIDQKFQAGDLGPGEVYGGMVASRLLPMYKAFANKQAEKIKTLQHALNGGGRPR